MPKIQVLVESYSGEGIVAELEAAANAATPDGVVPRAIPNRDANGKLVSVDVHLPEADAAGLVAAASKINQNPGVSKAGPFPLGGVTESFNSETPGATLALSGVTLIKDIGGLDARIRGDSGPSGTNIVAAASADSVGGTGSALLTEDATTGIVNVGLQAKALISLNAGDNGLTRIGACRMKATIKLKSGTGFLDNEANLTNDSALLRFGKVGVNSTLIMYRPVQFGNNNWHILDAVAGFQDTGVDRQSFITLESTWDFSGKVTMTGGSVTTVRDFGFVELSNGMFLRTEKDDSVNPAVSGTSRPFIIDDLEFEILSGQL